MQFLFGAVYNIHRILVCFVKKRMKSAKITNSYAAQILQVKGTTALHDLPSLRICSGIFAGKFSLLICSR